MSSNPISPVEEMSSIGSAEESKKWETVIRKARKSIGQLTVSMYQHVDIERRGISKGTGFYVDEKEGYVLTNKHVVGPGPSFGFIVFEGNIEVRPWPNVTPSDYK